MEKGKSERVKEIVEKMEKRTPQKAKNPSLIQKEIKKELKKEEPKKEKKKEEPKKESGKKKGPGIPDGTGPYSGTDECPMKNKKEARIQELTDKVKKIIK